MRNFRTRFVAEEGPTEEFVPTILPHPRSGSMRPSSELLTIAFARIQGGPVSGKLDPYRDPGCGCIVNTTFTGLLRDSSTLEGTFVTTANGPSPRSGATGA